MQNSKRKQHWMQSRKLRFLGQLNECESTVRKYFFRLDLGNIVENFEKSNNRLWGDFILVDFKREFISHCMKDDGFESVDF